MSTKVTQEKQYLDITVRQPSQEQRIASLRLQLEHKARAKVMLQSIHAIKSAKNNSSQMRTALVNTLLYSEVNYEEEEIGR